MKIRETVAVVIMLAAVVVGLDACALFTKPFARSVLDFVQIACIIENATLGDAKVAQVCSVANELMPDLRRLLELQRAALAAAREEGAYSAKHAGPDAGTDAR